jgi:hypothetical protein
MTGIAFLIRETVERGVRAYAEKIDGPIPEGSRVIRTSTRFAHGVSADEEGNAIPGTNHGEIELLLPNLGGSMSPNGRPVLWWRLERKTGEHIEQVWKGSKKAGAFEPVTVTEWDPEWKLAAGDMTDAMESMWWVYEWAIAGELFAPRSEWLACEVCDEAQLVSKAKGAKSAKQKCHMTPYCEGIVRRLPQFLDVPALKINVAPKAKKIDPDGPAITPGALRFKERGGVVLDADEEYDDDDADDYADVA